MARVWERHNHRNPCPVCGETKKGCRTNTETNVIHCRGENPSPAYRFLKEDKHGFGMYKLESEISDFSEEKKQQWLEEKRLEKERWLEAENQKIKSSLSNQERDRAIREILSQLPLTDEDKERLKARGLSDHAIQAGGYRSVTQWQKLETPVSPALAGVNRYGRGLNNPCDGIVVPIPNQNGEYVALRFHDPNAQETGNGKYTWLASNKQGCTQKDKETGEYPLAVYYPSEIRYPNRVGLCEGLEWKPKLAAERLGYPVIGFAGVSFFPQSPQLLNSALQELEANELIFIPDAGAVLNPRVIEPSIELFNLLEEWGYEEISIAWWNQSEKSDGDIDEISEETISNIALISPSDYLAKNPDQASYQRELESEAGSKLISQQEWEQQQSELFWDWFYQEIVNDPIRLFDPAKKSNEASRFKQAVKEKTIIRFGIDPLPTPEDAKALGDFSIQFKAGDRLKLASALHQAGFKHILDTSHAGSGKSHEWNQFQASDGKTYYISIQHRNPTVSTAENKADVPSRHNGLTLDYSRTTPNGNPYQHRWEYSQETPTPDVEGNCHQADKFNKLLTKGYDIHGSSVQSEDGSGQTDNAICAGCSKRPTCLIAGYKAQRQEAFKQDELRIHPDSHASVEKEDINIWEEVSESFQASQTIKLNTSDIEKTFNWLEEIALETGGEFEQIYRRLSKIKHKLIAALAGKIKLPHFGGTALPDASAEENLIHLLGLDFYPELAGDLEILSEVITEKSALEDKDLADFRDNQVDLNSLTPKERKRWRDTIKFANARLYGETAQHNEQVIANLPTLGLDQALKVIFGLQRGSVRMRNGEIILTLPDHRHAELAKNAKMNVYLDATIDPHWLATKTGLERNEIALIEQEKPDYSNLTVHSIYNEGMASRHFSDDCQRRNTAIIEQIQSEKSEEVPILGYKGSETLYWFNHNRATNELKGVKDLIVIGTPHTNLGEVKDEYYALKGSVEGFDDFYNRLTQDEIIQLVGRQRPHLYPNQEFNIYWINSKPEHLEFLEDMGITVIHREGLELTPKAGKSRQQTMIQLLIKAIKTGEDFFNQTQTEIAEQIGVTQKNISEILGKLNTVKHGKKIPWQERLKRLYRSLYKRFIGNGIKSPEELDYQQLSSMALLINEIRSWLGLPVEDSLGMLESTITAYISQLVDLINQGEDITKIDEISGLHPLLIISMALGASPPT